MPTNPIPEAQSGLPSPSSSMGVGGSGGGTDAFSGATGLLGAAQLMQGIIQQRQANKIAPPLVDPAQQSFLSDLNMKRKNLGFSGIGFGQGQNLVNQNLAITLDKIAKVNSGNAGATVAGFAAAQNGANAGINSVGANETQRDSFYTNLAGDFTNRIAQRRLDLLNYTRIQKMAQAMTNRQAGFDNVGNFLSSFDPSKLTGGSGAAGAAATTLPPIV